MNGIKEAMLLFNNDKALDFVAWLYTWITVLWFEKKHSSKVVQRME